MIDRDHRLPIALQARLLGLARSSVHARPALTSECDLAVMTAIDLVDTELPLRQQEERRKAPRPRLGRRAAVRRHPDVPRGDRRNRSEAPQLAARPGHKIQPYRSRELEISEAGHVGCADVTYLPMARGFCYPVAVMD